MRNTFHDPSNTFPDYVWDIGHATEQEAGRDMPVQASANVANTRVITQQGDLGPVSFSYQGAILTRAQVVAFWQWLNLCQYQTIHFYDFAGDQYEVVITSFKPVRVAGRNRRGGDEAPLWYWTYTLTMEVVTILAGPMFDAGLRS